MIEIERKFRLSAQQRQTIERILKKEYGTPVESNQIDEVFLKGMNTFKHFKQGMPVIRLRTENHKTLLTYKRRVNDDGDTIEHELAIDSADTMKLILSEMDYQSVTYVKKKRQEIKVKDGFNVVLDAVEGLGDFLEIETVTGDDTHIIEIEYRIMKIAESYGLTESDLERKKYDQLLAELQ